MVFRADRKLLTPTSFPLSSDARSRSRVCVGDICGDLIVKSFGPTKNVTDLAKLVRDFMAAPNLGEQWQLYSNSNIFYVFWGTPLIVLFLCLAPSRLSLESPLDAEIAHEMSTDVKAYETKALAAAAKAPVAGKK